VPGSTVLEGEPNLSVLRAALTGHARLQDSGLDTSDGHRADTADLTTRKQPAGTIARELQVDKEIVKRAFSRAGW
jgi:hypothetical protein